MSDVDALRTFETVAELAALVRAFEECTLPRDDWNHPAHLAVAGWYLARHDECDAVRRVISGIRRYNHAHGIESGPRGGYHETITLFWLAVVRAHLHDHSTGSAQLIEAINELLARVGSRPDLPSEYYTAERLWSAEARTHWLPPDLKSLDDVAV